MIPKNAKQEGFTLIELLVVVVIIGILASVAIPNFMGAQDKAKNSGVQSNAHNVQMQIEQFAVDASSVYPANLDTAANDLYNTSTYGNGYPKTPWNTQQSSASAIATTVTDAVNNSYGAGTLAAPTALTNYGAISYLRTGTANERYDLSGTGKAGGNAVCVFHTRNY